MLLRYRRLFSYCRLVKERMQFFQKPSTGGNASKGGRYVGVNIIPPNRQFKSLPHERACPAIQPCFNCSARSCPAAKAASGVGYELVLSSNQVGLSDLVILYVYVPAGVLRARTVTWNWGAAIKAICAHVRKRLVIDRLRIPPGFFFGAATSCAHPNRCPPDFLFG